MNLSRRAIFHISFFFIAITLVLMAIYFDGTGGGGDSIFHYLYAKYAQVHPENFFDHWAKPVFTILAFPFAQLGFIGIKIFNIIMSLSACYLGYLVLNQLKTNHAEYYALVLFSITLYVNVTLSGLTEPLSAAMLMLGIYFILKNKAISGISVISFLPFVRSEGLVIMGAFFLYLVFTKKYKMIPWLMTGHILMSILGSFYHHDILWVFNKIPYAHLQSTYGKGTWMHFFEQLYFQMGLIEYSCLLIACFVMAFALIKRNNIAPERIWLIYGCFGAFFIAHSSFWALGIFNSMGLTRVFVSVMPLAAIMVIDAINFLEELITKYYAKSSRLLVCLILTSITIIPFANTPSSYKIPKDFELENSQLIIKNKLTPYIEKYAKDRKIVFADLSIAFFTNKDVFDTNACQLFYKVKDFSKLKSQDVIIWDNWFGPTEFGISLDSMKHIPIIKMDTIFEGKNEKNGAIQFAVFSKNYSSEE